MKLCPKCGRVMKAIGESHGGVSAGKAVVGAALLGPVGLLGGLLGKKHVTYQCVIEPVPYYKDRTVGCGYTIQT